jgi:ketol-acid reductoisomerase
MEASVAQKNANVFRRGVPCTVAAANDDESNGASAASAAALACAMGPGLASPMSTERQHTGANTDIAAC